jgi:OOP family OmpA-OmpF porin
MIYSKIRLCGCCFTVVLISLCLAVPAWAQATAQPALQNTSQKSNKLAEKAESTQKYGVGRAMGDVYAASSVRVVPADKSRLVVYRNPNAKQQGVMSIYINGGYHTALMQAGFSSVCLLDPNVSLRTRLRSANAIANAELDKTISFIVNKGQSQFVRLTELADGNVQLDVVNEQQASKELTKTREQMHALSRVESATPCEERKTADALEGVVLVAYIEFEAGKSRLTDMIPADLSELDRLVDKLKGQNQKRLRVQVSGYANDGDKKTPSKQLAESRAKTVEDYILSQGLNPKTLNTEFHADKSSASTAVKANSVVVLSATFEQP